MAAAMLCLQSEAPAWKRTFHWAATKYLHVRVEMAWQHWQLGLGGATPLHASAGGLAHIGLGAWVSGITRIEPWSLDQRHHKNREPG